MRSITVKVILIILVTALMGAGLYWAAATSSTLMPNPTEPQSSTPPPTIPTHTSSTAHSHDFGSEWFSDEQFHWQACSCEKQANVAAHTDLNGDEICDTCKKAVPSTLHRHDFSPNWDFDEDRHWHSCICGEPTDIAPHMDVDGNQLCDICEIAVSPSLHEHHYGNSWNANESHHWRSCICGETTDIASHTDVDGNQFCDTCEIAVSPLLHEHNFDTNWNFDENNHFHSCICGETADSAPHEDVDGNQICDTCEAAVSPLLHTHNFNISWNSDETNHWHSCICGNFADLAPHNDSDTNGKCDVCDADVPLPPHVHEFNGSWLSNDSGHWQLCDCGDSSESAPHVNTDNNYLCDVCSYMVQQAAPPQISSSTHAFIYNYNDEQYLFCNRDLDQDIYPASITKMFAAHVALMYLDPTDVVTLGKEQGFYDSDSSQAGFKRGDMVTVDALLHGLIMRSGADCAYGLAVAAGRKISGQANLGEEAAVSVFINEMNTQAALHDLGTTHFVTPDGYHAEGHVITFGAFVTIAKLALENPYIMEISRKLSIEVTVPNSNNTNRTVTIENTNELLKPDGNFYCEYAIGLKTGNTNAAGKCFLGIFQYEGEYVIVGVFGCSTHNQRWQETLALWNYYLMLISP